MSASVNTRRASPISASGKRVTVPSTSTATLSHALEALAPVEGMGELDLGLVAVPALEIRAADKRPVDAGRGNLEIVGAVDRVLDVEGRRDVARDGLAILDVHGAVGLLGHDLDRHAVQRRDLDAHQPVAEALDDRLDDMRDAGLEPGLGDDARFDFRRFRQAPCPRPA